MAGKIHVGMIVDGALVDIGTMSLADLIPAAFRVKPYQLNGPDWLGQNRFDIRGKIPDGVSKDQVPEMLQALLADRFKLAYHRETREHPIYALVVAKGGPKMKASVAEPEPPQSADGAEKGIRIGTADGSQASVTVMKDAKGVVVNNGANGTMRMTPGPDGMHMEASGMTMQTFADAISRLVDRPIIDMTELKGGYDVALDFSIADLMTAARANGAGAPVIATIPLQKPPGSDGAPDPSSSSIFAGLQKLGLKLEPRKVPVETIVIDHVEKTPTEN